MAIAIPLGLVMAQGIVSAADGFAEQRNSFTIPPVISPATFATAASGRGGGRCRKRATGPSPHRSARFGRRLEDEGHRRLRPDCGRFVEDHNWPSWQ
ncbi:MAG: hypothetical protein MZV49_07065 [Rhodopseudomonas palustris]|nr:hypothetical protein [Rhodopseudomonas palustris]